MVGVNFPWRHYGGDFGPTVWGTHTGIAGAAADVDAECRRMAAHGVRVLRWFLFTDGRGGIEIDRREWPARLHPAAIADLDALLEAVARHGLQLVPVLLDHTLAFRARTSAGATLGGHGDWLADPDAQGRLLGHVVAPLVSRYGPRGPRAELGSAIYAWDLLNEPDWLVAELAPSPLVEQPVAFDVLARWVRESAGVVHEHQARVTIGGARLRFAHWWDDEQLGLDFLQAHAYYTPAHDLDLLRTPYAALGLTRPLVIGECAARGDGADPRRRRPAVDVRTLAGAALRLGYAAAWPWSWRGVDVQGAVPPEAMAAIAAEAAAGPA